MKFLRSIPTAAAAFAALLVLQSSASPVINHVPRRLLSDTTKKDSVVYETVKGLPLKPQRRINFTTTEGSWTSLDMSPNGKTIVFDMMGDLFTIPYTTNFIWSPFPKQARW